MKRATQAERRIAFGAATAGKADAVRATVTVLIEAAAEVLTAALPATPEPRWGHRLEHMTGRVLGAGGMPG
jgi:hypothetical protein